LIALTTAAACVVWLTLAMRWVGLIGGCLALLVVGSCFGYDFYNLKLGPLPLTADRLMVGLLVGLYALQRASRILPSRSCDKPDYLFAAFLLTITASTFVHDWRWRDYQPVASLLFLYLVPACVYWVLRGSVVRERQLQILFAVLALFGVYLGLTAIAEVSQTFSLVFPRFIVTTKFTQWIGRARGPFLNPTTNGLYLGVSLFAWAMLWPHARRWGRLAILSGMAVVASGVFLTLTRSAWIGTAIGLILIALAVLPRHLKVPAILWSCVLALPFFVLADEHWLSFKRDKDVSQYHMEQSAKLRPILAAVAWRVFQDYPVFGCGYGQYKRVDVDYLKDPTSELPLEQAKNYVQHNLFLGILVDTGLLGLALYLGTLAGWGWRAWKLWNDPRISLLERQLGLLLLAVLAHWGFNGMFHDVALAAHANVVLFVIAGIGQSVWLARNRRGS
jgi:O-antigen ligase